MQTEGVSLPMLCSDRATRAKKVAGPSDSFDSESLQTDPSCRSGWFGPSCARSIVWSEYVIYQHQTGQLREIAHQSCTGEARCHLIESLAVDGASVIASGTFAQRIPTVSP